MDSSVVIHSIHSSFFYVFLVAALVRVFLQTSVIFPDLPKAGESVCSKMFEAFARSTARGSVSTSIRTPRPWPILPRNQTDTTMAVETVAKRGLGYLFICYLFFPRRFRKYIGSVEIMEIIWIWPIILKRRPGGRGTYAQPGEHQTRRLEICEPVGKRTCVHHVYTVEHYRTHTKDVCVWISYSY